MEWNPSWDSKRPMASCGAGSGIVPTVNNNPSPGDMEANPTTVCLLWGFSPRSATSYSVSGAGEEPLAKEYWVWSLSTGKAGPLHSASRWGETRSDCSKRPTLSVLRSYFSPRTASAWAIWQQRPMLFLQRFLRNRRTQVGYRRRLNPCDGVLFAEDAPVKAVSGIALNSRSMAQWPMARCG